MKTSIKGNLFFITYSIFLAFIVGLIILNNTYLETFYRSEREESLKLAFSEIKNIDLTSATMSEEVLAIESEYNINVEILQEISGEDVPIIIPGGGSFNDVVIPYDVLYGDRTFIRNNVLLYLLSEFQDSPLSGTVISDVTYLDMYSDEGYTLYTADLDASPDQTATNSEMIGLVVQKVSDTTNNQYYILTVTIQSIQDSVKVFNSFTIMVGIGFMILSAFVVYFFSYKFTTPILEITRVTKKLSNLDFSDKVDIKSSDELGVLGESINKMSSQLENSIQELKEANIQLSQDIELKTQIDQMRKDFIASASHELKTPISIILGYAEALKLPDINQTSKEEYLDIIMDESDKMNRLVMNLLKLSQVESGIIGLNYSDFSIEEFSSATLRYFKMKFDELGIQITMNIDDLEIHSDYEQLQTVLNNFISNALHHIDNKKKLEISFKQLEGSVYRYSVYNSGNAIPENDLERIWDSFYKVDKARTRSYGGQGLGLSIVKNILEQLHYPYGVMNQKDGVLFYFDIDVSPREE